MFFLVLFVFLAHDALAVGFEVVGLERKVVPVVVIRPESADADGHNFVVSPARHRLPMMGLQHGSYVLEVADFDHVAMAFVSDPPLQGVAGNMSLELLLVDLQGSVVFRAAVESLELKEFDRFFMHRPFNQNAVPVANDSSRIVYRPTWSFQRVVADCWLVVAEDGSPA